MPTTPLDPARHARRQLAALATAVALLMFAVTMVVIRWRLDAHADPTPSTTRPSAAAPTPNPAVTWHDVAGVNLPFSPVHGPRVTEHGHAAGYAHTEQGAALAAVQVLLRTSATAGPDVYRPLLARQVAGANAKTLAHTLDEQYQQLRSQSDTAEGRPIPGNDATIAGYLVTAYGAGAAVVEVLLSAPRLGTSQLVGFAISLRWVDGDWRVVAPPQGDWGTVAHVVGAPPPRLRDFSELA